MVETEEFLQPALTHTHTASTGAAAVSALSLILILGVLVYADVDVAVATLPWHSGTHSHWHRHTRIFVIFIFSFRLLAWRFLIAMISFHLCFNFISFQTTARTLSLHLACADCSPHYPTRLHTHTRHTQIEQVACNQ